MRPILFHLFDTTILNNALQDCDDFEMGELMLRQFPDDETYIKINTKVKDRKVILIASLDRPNTKLLPLIFICETIRDLGAKEVGLVAPYLAYMRQDKIFHPGESITSKYFASLLSQHFNWLVTIDPHLHRINKLDEIYAIPTTVLHAIIPISHWIINEVNNPLLIGPDSESEQQVSPIAKNIGAPYVLCEKIREGDHDVKVIIPELEKYSENIPILIDDIISTGKTMVETIHYLKIMKMKSPICIGVHGIFSGDAYSELLNSGADSVITCNTIKHVSNAIDLGSILIHTLKDLVGDTQ
jgi:ribose-phosphate pyrophosphokinase